MTTPHLKNSMDRSPSRLGLLLIPVVFACFALTQSAQSVGPEPGEDDAVAELGSATVEAAMGQAANTPNKREIPFNIKKPLQCAGGDVILSGNLVITFIHPRVGVVTPHSVKLEGFRGLAKSGNRKLEATKPRVLEQDFRLDEATKEGRFGVQFHVTGPGLPGGSPFRIRVEYKPNVYKYADGKVTKLTPDPMPIVRCQ
jgi:hypothetical protein